MFLHLGSIGTYRRDVKLIEIARKNMRYIANPGCRLALCLLVLTAISLTLIGCGGTPGETGTERSVRYGTIIRSNYGSMKDDVDMLLLMDKRSKLSKSLIRDY